MGVGINILTPFFFIMKNQFLVSRDKLCEFAKSDNPDNWKRCHLPYSHHYELSYSIVYEKSHLDIQKYDCGCLIYHNKYHQDFKFPELIWKDFFTDTIGEGDKLVKFSVRKSTKK